MKWTTSRPKDGRWCCVGAGKTRRRGATSPGSTAQSAIPAARLGVTTITDGTKSQSGMIIHLEGGQGKRGTWTHSTGDPPETDKQGGERNGHRPRTHKTDTPTGNVCTTSQYDKSTGTQPSASVHTITQYSQRRARLMVPNRRPLSVGRYTAWPAVSVGDDVFICNYHIHTHTHISPLSLSSFTTRSIRQFMTLQWNSLHRTPIETS